MMFGCDCFRYKSLGESEKKRLEMDEDHLLGVMLYNQIAVSYTHLTLPTIYSV